MNVLKLQFWLTEPFLATAKGNYYIHESVLRLSQKLLKMTESKNPPLGSFQLHPLSIATRPEAKVNQALPIKKLCATDTPGDVESVGTARGNAQHKETLNAEENILSGSLTASDVEDAHNMTHVQNTDSMVMSKMVISGPPSKAKRQKVLPESLLQKVTEMVRQQTSCPASTEPDVNSQRDTVLSSVDSEFSHMCSVKRDISDPASLTKGCSETVSDCVLGEKVATPEPQVAQHISQSIDTHIHPSSNTDTLAKTAEKVVETGENNDNAILKCEALHNNSSSCDMETENLTSGTSEVNKNIRPSPDKDETETHDMLFQEAGKSVFKNEDSRNEMGFVDNELEPFVNLLANEEDADSEKTPVKKDDVFDISVLFTGELEKRRKKELKKTKLNSFKKSKKAKKWAGEKSPREEGKDDDDQKKKQYKPIPNYFVSIQISNPEIVAGIQRVQEDVVSGNEALKPAMNKLATIHLTMFVVHLTTDEEMSRAKKALDKCNTKLRELQGEQLLALDVSGLGNFRNNVVFAKITNKDQIDRLKTIAEILDDCFMDEELVSTEKPGSFKPHITIMKLTRDKSFRKKGGIKKIDESLYKEHINTEFGRQYVNTLQLCAMLRKKAESGYYQVDHCVQFGPSISDGITGHTKNEMGSAGCVVTISNNEASAVDECEPIVGSPNEQMETLDNADVKFDNSNKIIDNKRDELFNKRVEILEKDNAFITPNDLINNGMPAVITASLEDIETKEANAMVNEGSSKLKGVSLISTSNGQEISISSKTVDNNFDAEPDTQINSSLTSDRDTKILKSEVVDAGLSLDTKTSEKEGTNDKFTGSEICVQISELDLKNVEITGKDESDKETTNTKGVNGATDSLIRAIPDIKTTYDTNVYDESKNEDSNCSEIDQNVTEKM